MHEPIIVSPPTTSSEYPTVSGGTFSLTTSSYFRNQCVRAEIVGMRVGNEDGKDVGRELGRNVVLAVRSTPSISGEEVVGLLVTGAPVGTVVGALLGWAEGWPLGWADG